MSDRESIMRAEEAAAYANGVPEHSVNDIPDVELLRRAVGRRGHGRKEPRWVRVMDRFSLGSTYARQLCRRFGFDPDEKVGA